MIPLVTVLLIFAAGLWVGAWGRRWLRCGPLCPPGEFERAVADRDAEMYDRGRREVLSWLEERSTA